MITQKAGPTLHERFLKGLTQSFGIDVLQNVKRFVLLPVLTKVLGTVNYGVWAQIGATVDFASTLSNLGLGAAMSRYLPGLQREQLRREFWMSIAVVTGSSLAVCLLLVAFSGPLAAGFFGGGQYAAYVTLGAALLLLRVVRYHLVLYFRLMLDMGPYSRLVLADSAASLLLYVAVALIQGTVLSIAVAAVCLEIVLAVWVVWLVVARLGFAAPDLGQLKRYLRLGLPTVPMGASNWALNSLDRFVIAYYLGIGAVGIYSVGYSLGFMAVSVIAAPLWAVIPGRVNAAWNAGDREEALETLRKVLRYWVLLATPIACAVVFWGDFIVRTLASREFTGAVVVIPWVVAAYGLEYTASHYRTMLFWTERTRIFVVSFPLAALVNLGLNLWLVPKFGILGSAIATSASYGVLFACDMGMCMRLGLPRLGLSGSLRAIALGIVLGVVVSRLPARTWLESGTGLLGYFMLYAVACHLTGLATAGELRSGLRALFGGATSEASA